VTAEHPERGIRLRAAQEAHRKAALLETVDQVLGLPDDPMELQDDPAGATDDVEGACAEDLELASFAVDLQQVAGRSSTSSSVRARTRMRRPSGRSRFDLHAHEGVPRGMPIVEEERDLIRLGLRPYQVRVNAVIPARWTLRRSATTSSVRQTLNVR